MVLVEVTMSGDTISLAILFADIAKSTQLYDRLGNENAQTLISTCLSVFALITREHQGKVVKTIGDEIMCTFPDVNLAVDAAKAMQLGLGHITLPSAAVTQVPNIYVGIHTGPVVEEAQDVFGDAVNIAARMVSLAKQRQILMTHETIGQLKPEHQESAQLVDKTVIKGKSGETEIYEIVWERQDVTVILDEAQSGMNALPVQTSLELTYNDNTYTVDQDSPSTTIGRQVHNEIVVNDYHVSRTHARIEYRRGKFILIDQSTNGTFALMQGKRNLILRREEGQLHGSGVIALGREVEDDLPHAIHYAINV